MPSSTITTTLSSTTTLEYGQQFHSTSNKHHSHTFRNSNSLISNGINQPGIVITNPNANNNINYHQLNLKQAVSDSVNHNKNSKSISNLAFNKAQTWTSPQPSLTSSTNTLKSIKTGVNSHKSERTTALLVSNQPNPIAPSLYQPNLKPLRTSSISSSPTYPISNQSSSNYKMAGGIRRTVSSAAAQASTIANNSVRLNTSIPSKVNTQMLNNKNSTNGHQHKSLDSHKKLDRSYSEPAEKKQQNHLSSNVSSTQSTNVGIAQTSSRYKTELCRSFAEVGQCKYGDKCQFAHGGEELRTITRHPKFKTENCKSFHSTGFCPYGPRCHFIHNSEESTKSPLSNLLVSSNQMRLSENNPLPIANMIGGVNQIKHHNFIEQNMSGSSVMMAPNSLSFKLSNNQNLIRPKALSLGSYSLGSSGETSSPSSQSGSPTSLNSFFSDETAFVNFAPNSKLSTNFPANKSSTFSFSPDSAFVAFDSIRSNNSGSNFNTLASNGQKYSFENNSNQTSMVEDSEYFSIEPNVADQTTNSVISQLFRSTSDSPTSFDSAPFNDILASSMLINNNSTLMSGNNCHFFYPASPESPVDSIASEIEALKLGEQPPICFSSMSSSLSSMSNQSSPISLSSPPNAGNKLNAYNNGHQRDLDAFDLIPTRSIDSHSTIQSNPMCIGSSANVVNIPRLPTFTKIATASSLIVDPIVSSSPNRSIESLD
ncbi:mRNA decay activator protein ZFP36L2 [Sarcoptes scabiei]|nr:mRNA decay activator protein ZFP36L2 [Sarcoptes scabiei]